MTCDNLELIAENLEQEYRERDFNTGIYYVYGIKYNEYKYLLNSNTKLIVQTYKWLKRIESR